MPGSRSARTSDGRELLLERWWTSVSAAGAAPRTPCASDADGNGNGNGNGNDPLRGISYEDLRLFRLRRRRRPPSPGPAADATVTHPQPVPTGRGTQQCWCGHSAVLAAPGITSAAIAGRIAANRP
jgi:hypothetical protein